MNSDSTMQSPFSTVIRALEPDIGGFFLLRPYLFIHHLRPSFFHTVAGDGFPNRPIDTRLSRKRPPIPCCPALPVRGSIKCSLARPVNPRTCRVAKRKETDIRGNLGTMEFQHQPTVDIEPYNPVSPSSIGYAVRSPHIRGQYHDSYIKIPPPRGQFGGPTEKCGLNCLYQGWNLTIPFFPVCRPTRRCRAAAPPWR